MRSKVVFAADAVLVLGASVMAISLRHDFVLTSERMIASLPYLVATMLAMAIVWPSLEVHKAIWRLSASRDYVRVLGGTIAVVLSALTLTFAWSRLEGVARSLPFIQFAVMSLFLVLARFAARLRHARRRRHKDLSNARAEGLVDPVHNVLVVGLGPVSDLYIAAVREMAPAGIAVVGLLGRAEKHVGRRVGDLEVLGLPEDLESVIRALAIRGVVVDIIAVTVPRSEQSDEARAVLEKVADEAGIAIDFVAERLVAPGLSSLPSGPTRHESYLGPRSGTAKGNVSLDAETSAAAERGIWHVKRAIDIVAAVCGFVVGAPLLLLIAFLHMLFGPAGPILFWQVRPGRHGVPFMVYKFSTMGPAHGAFGARIPDHLRSTLYTNLLRRTRLDELPQLWNILVGEMSLVGPRPLLPIDQPEGDRARLLVRPGLTGWAQVCGGRDISPEEKAARDAWYVRNASLMLDIKILLKTLVFIFIRGEQKPQSGPASAASSGPGSPDAVVG